MGEGNPPACTHQVRCVFCRESQTVDKIARHFSHKREEGDPKVALFPSETLRVRRAVRSQPASPSVPSQR